MLDPGPDVEEHVLAVHRPAPTLVRLTSSRAGVPEGESVALVAQVRTLVSGGPAPSGAVTFRAGPRVLGTAALDASGQAVLGGVLLDAGVHAITAAYPGDEQHSAATSSPLPQVVQLSPGELRADFAGDTEHAPATGSFLDEAAAN